MIKDTRIKKERKDTRTKKERMEALMNMTDEDIDYSDIPDFPDEVWATAKVKPPLIKKQISIRIKPATINAIKKQSRMEGIGYQTKINAILDYYVMHNLYQSNNFK